MFNGSVIIVYATKVSFQKVICMLLFSFKMLFNCDLLSMLSLTSRGRVSPSVQFVVVVVYGGDVGGGAGKPPAGPKGQ